MGRETTRPVYAIFGKDAFLRHRKLEELIGQVLGADRDKMAVAEFDGDAELADVLDECRTPSLLAPLRLVYVRDADEFIKEHRKAIEKYLDNPSPTGVLVLVCQSWKASTRLYKQVAKIGRNIGCEPPSRYNLPGWLIGHARESHGCRLENPAAMRLIDLVGDELGLLDMELSKLATFVAPETVIQEADVESLVGSSRAEKVFGVTDAIARRDVRKALEMWEQVLANDRDAPYKAIGGLAYGFRKLVEAKRLVEQGLSVAEAAKRTNVWGDPGGIKRQLDRFALRQWQDHLVKLLEIDVACKTGLGKVPTSVERLIVELCTVA